MSKRKKFGASAANKQAISDSIAAVNNRDSRYGDANVKMEYIAVDPNNPRELSLTERDVEGGLTKSDPDYDKKKQELEMISELAASISKSGLIHPIILLRLGNNEYQIIAGECRFLAFVFLKKIIIPARIFSTQPDSYDLKLIQWEENTRRRDLTLYERLENIDSLVKAFAKTDPGTKVNSATISQITGLSSSQAEAYYAILKGSKIVYAAVKDGVVNNLHKAVLAASPKLDDDLRCEVLSLFKSGASLVEVRKFLTTAKKGTGTKKRQPKKQNISLGKVEKPEIIYSICDAVSKVPGNEGLIEQYGNMDWSDTKSVKKAFSVLIAYLENKMGDEK